MDGEKRLAALQDAALAVSSARGERIFAELTRYLAAILHCELALIGAVSGERIRTLGVHGIYGYVENFEYPLPIHSPYTTHTQPIHSPYTAHTQPIHSPYTAHTQPIHNPYEAHTQSTAQDIANNSSLKSSAVNLSPQLITEEPFAHHNHKFLMDAYPL